MSMSDPKVDARRPPDPQSPLSGGAAMTPELAAAHAQLWQSQGQPVHERHEQTRRFRTAYALVGLVALLVLNGAALGFLPLVGLWLGIPLGGQVDVLLMAQGWFVRGLMSALAALLFSYIVLDIDVMRHKRETVVARHRIALALDPAAVDAGQRADLDKALRGQRHYWLLGVGLSWTVVATALISGLSLAVGLVTAGDVLHFIAAQR